MAPRAPLASLICLAWAACGRPAPEPAAPLPAVVALAAPAPSGSAAPAPSASPATPSAPPSSAASAPEAPDDPHAGDKARGAANAITVLFSAAERRVATSDHLITSGGSGYTLQFHDPEHLGTPESFDLCTDCDGNDVDDARLPAALRSRLARYEGIERVSWARRSTDLALEGLGALRWKRPQIQLVQRGKVRVLGTIQHVPPVPGAEMVPVNAVYIRAARVVVVRAEIDDSEVRVGWPATYTFGQDHVFRVP